MAHSNNSLLHPCATVHGAVSRLRDPVRRVIPAIGLATLLLAGCRDALMEPARKGPAGVALQFNMSAAETAMGAAAAAAFDKADVAWVRVTGGPVVTDTLVPLLTGAEETRVRLEVGLARSRENVQLDVELRRGSDALFRWRDQVELHQGRTIPVVAVLEPVVSRVQAADSVPALTAVGDTAFVHAAALFATGDTVPGAVLEWQSLDPAVVQVVAGGVIIARANGQTSIVVGHGGLADTIAVAVRQRVTAVTRPAGADTLFADYEVTLRPADSRGVSIPLPLTWSSSDTTVARVHAAGTVTGVQPGDVVITGVLDGVPASVPVRIVAVPAASIAAGVDHTCAVAANEATWCWGGNNAGQLGRLDAPWIGSPVPVQAQTPASFSHVAGGAHRSCGVAPDGVWCWGFNQLGQLGIAAPSQWPFAVPNPTLVPGSQQLRSVVLAQATWPFEEEHTCGLTGTGEAYCWGSNSHGQLGTGGGTWEASPVPAAGGLRFRRLAAGHAFTCGIAPDGAAWCWGRNDAGQLGSGSGAAQHALPQQVAGGMRFARLVAGQRHACGLTTTGEAYCWGDNEAARLGMGSRGGHQRAPVVVSGGYRFIEIAAGGNTTCALEVTLQAVCWGLNHHAQLGIGNTFTPTVPAPVSTAVRFRGLALGDGHVCGVATAGTLHCWGRLQRGELGDGRRGYSSLPVPVSGGLQFSDVQAGAHSFSCGLETSGIAYCWGMNWDGQLGNGTFMGGGPFTTPVRVSGSRTFTRLSAGHRHVCALAPDGAAFCWGSNVSHELGSGGSADRYNTPQPVSGGIIFASISAGSDYSCGLTSGGEAWCWGTNNRGQLGDGTRTTRSAPTRVAGSQAFAIISTGQNHTCAVTTSGEPWCWGSNDWGQLGDGSRTDRLVPTSVGGSLTLSSIEAEGWWGHGAASCGVAVDGTVRCWGFGAGCNFGTSNCNTVDHLLPIVAAEGRTVTAVSHSGSGGCGLDTDGRSFCWGGNYSGEMGVGHTGERIGALHTDPGSHAPLPTDGGLTFATISKRTHTCGVTTAGAAYCWGLHDYGALGDGNAGFATLPQQVHGGVIFR
jgi:alpha-tubulin suppressor-like RCC1 family protein